MNKRSIVLISTILLASNPILSSSVVFANQANSNNVSQIENTTEASLRNQRSDESLKSNTSLSDSNDEDSLGSIESDKNLKEKNIEITGVSEQISETKENELDQTESSGQVKETEDTEVKAKVKKSIANKNGITASVNAPNKFQTYIDPITNVGPSEITISISVSISQPGLENTFIEIPYGFTPNSENPNFKSFTMSEPIFNLIEPEIPAEDSIVDSYEEKKMKIN